MIDFDKWKEIFDSIRKHKLRTFLTALAVWWGIFMLVILLGAGNGLQNSTERNFRDDAINSLWLYPSRTSQPYKGLPAGRWIHFTNKDYDLIKNRVKGIEYITGRYYLSGEYMSEYKGKALSFDVRGVHPDHKYLENTIITSGRFINEKDIDKLRKVCVIGKLVKEGFFQKEEDPLGKYLTIKGTKFQIVGVFRDEGHENEMRKIYLPITTTQRTFGKDDRINQLMVTVGDASKAESVEIENSIRRELAALHNFAAKDKRAIYINNSIKEYQDIQMLFTGIRVFIWFVGIGSIIAGVVGVSNIMLIIVKDRTKEIGIRKAMGATPWSIISMIMQEAIFLTGLSGYLGLLSGFSIIYLLKTVMENNNIEMKYFYNPDVNFGSVLSALIFLVICGTLAGLIPAIQAVRVNPVIAMRT